MNLRRIVLQSAVAGGGLWLVSSAARAQAPSLDGRRFEGVFIQRGKTKGDADTLTFAGGRFRSSACDRYGYGDAPYRTSVQGDAIAFEAETVSAKHGKLVWRGTVRGDKLDATALAQRDGQAAVENWVVAGTPK
jgi:hypothetical protein